MMTKQTPLSSIEGLRQTLAETLESFRKGEITYKDADSISNIAGKMINSAKAQIDYIDRKNVNVRIEWLESSIKSS